jgi:hypothetical protein
MEVQNKIEEFKSHAKCHTDEPINRYATVEYYEQLGSTLLFIRAHKTQSALQMANTHSPYNRQHRSHINGNVSVMTR